MDGFWREFQTLHNAHWQDRQGGRNPERERETADSWLAKQMDRQQTSSHLHIFPNLTAYIFTSWHLLIFTSSHLHIHLHIFSSSHPLIFSSSLPEFGPFSPEKLKKRTPATKPPRRSAEPSPEPKWTPGLIHRYCDPRGSGIWTFQPPKSSKSGPPQQSLPDVLRNLLRNQSEPLDSSTDTATRGGPEFGPFSPEKLKKRTPANKKKPAPGTQKSAGALKGRGCQCAVLNVLLFQPPLRALPQSLLDQKRVSGQVRPWLAPPPPPILLSSHLPEDGHVRKGLNSNLILLIHVQ